MRQAFLTAIAVLGVIGSVPVCVAATLKQFPTPAQAHAHCPRDTVVWLNLPTMIYCAFSNITLHIMHWYHA